MTYRGKMNPCSRVLSYIFHCIGPGLKFKSRAKVSKHIFQCLNRLGRLLSGWMFEPESNPFDFQVRFRSNQLLKQVQNLNPNPLISVRFRLGCRVGSAFSSPSYGSLTVLAAPQGPTSSRTWAFPS